MYFLELPFKNLSRRPLRAFFTLVGISAAVGSFMGFVGLSRGMQGACREILIERGTHIFAYPEGIVDLLGSSLDPALGHQIASLKGVKQVSEELIGLMELDTGQVIFVTGWPPQSFLWKSVSLERGRLPGPNDKHPVILGKSIADALGYDVGTEFTIRGKKFTVVGICKLGPLARNNTIIFPIKLLQELTNRDNKVSAFNIQIENPQDPRVMRKIIGQLSSKFRELCFVEGRSVSDNNKMLQIFRAMAWATSAVALFIGLAMIINTLLMSVLERTKEIGILKAIGWHPLRILSMILLEGILLAACGGIAGTLLGIVGIHWLSQFPQVKGFVYPLIDSGLIIEVVLGTFALGLIGSIYPALRAVSLNAAEAIRYE